ncbi:transcription termination factor NusA [Brucella melitensis]|nr:transcription termination factor NusA [Brucella melitensis]
MTTAMLVAVGEDGVKTMEDFAGYAVDDLVGWRERKDGDTINHSGV